jgi:uncharacterized protein
MQSIKPINQSSILAYLRLQKANFQRDFGLTKIGLFGSYAKDEANEASDVDIIVEFEPNTPDLYDKKETLRTILQNEFDRNVDLCREKYLKPYYKIQILQNSIFV